MTETLCIPSDWLDEFSPPPRLAPNDFLRFTENDGWHLTGDASNDLIEISPGAIISFRLFENYGQFFVSINKRTVEADREIPLKANFFYASDDSEVVAESLEGIAAEMGLLEGDNAAISACWWSEHDLFFEFNIIDGTGTFTKTAAN